MKFLLEGQVKGFMLNLMMYNINHFESFARDGQALMAAVRGKIQAKLKEKRETVLIKRNGKEVALQIDKEKEQKQMNRVSNLVKKDFNALFVDVEKKALDDKIGEDTDLVLRKRALANQHYNEREGILLKLTMILGAKCLRGILFVEALLEKIKVIKDVFLHQIEAGAEVYIPRELSQDPLPASYRYYDPILAIISENLSSGKREILALKQKVAHKLHFEGDLWRRFLLKTGVIEDPQEAKEKLVLRYTALNKKPPVGVDHHTSHHTKTLQRSRYIRLEDSIDKRFVLESQQKKALMRK